MHAHFQGCVCSCLCLCLPTPVLSMNTAPGCVPPHVHWEYSTLPWEEGASPSSSRAQEKTDPGRAWLPPTWYKMLKREVEAGQNCQLPAAASGSRERPSPPHLLRAARDGRGRRQQVVLPSRLRLPPGPLAKGGFPESLSRRPPPPCWGLLTPVPLPVCCEHRRPSGRPWFVTS